MQIVSRICFTALLILAAGAGQLFGQTGDAGLIEADRDEFGLLLSSHSDFFTQPADASTLRFAAFLQEGASPAEDAIESADDDADKTLRDALRALSGDSELLPPSNGEASKSDDDVSNSNEDGIGNELGSKDRIPELVHGRFQLPELKAVSINTGGVGTGKSPKGFRGDLATPSFALPESGAQRAFGDGQLPWDWQVLHWAAANTFSHPRYFEDRMLERHGHQRFRYLQPVVSGFRFFSGTVMLPYLTTVSRPCDCEYTLGYYRSGTCVPAYLQRPPWERKAVIAQGLAIGANAWILP